MKPGLYYDAEEDELWEYMGCDWLGFHFWNFSTNSIFVSGTKETGFDFIGEI